MFGQVGVHFLVEMPVPLQALAKARHPLAAPVLAPQAGDLDAVLQALVHDAKAALVATLGTDDEAVVDPLRQLRLAAQERGQLFQQLHECGGGFDADKARHIPALQLMVARVAEIEIPVSRGIHVEVIMAAGNVGRLRVIGVVIIAARTAVFHVAAPGNVGRFVAANTRLAGPQREVAAPQIKVTHLLAAAVDMLVLGRFHMQPKAVDALGFFRHRQGDSALFLGDQQLELALKIQLYSLLCHTGRSQGQGAALQQVIFQLEVATVHLHTLFAVADINHRGVGVGMQQHIAAVFQGKDPVFANDLHGCPFSAIRPFNSGAPCSRPAGRGKRPA